MYKNYTKIFCTPNGYVHKFTGMMRSAFSGISNTDKRKWIMRAKLTTFILLVTLMQVSASTFGQNLTLKKSDISFAKLFFEIRKQTGYNVLIKDTKFKTSKKLDADFQNTPLTAVLDKVAAELDLSYSIAEKTVVITEKEKSIIDKIADYFLNIDVRGKIADENGQPLIGASVSVKGTNRLVTTNEKGEFSFTGVDEKAILVISYIGYQLREVAVQKELGDIILIQLTTKLDEVAVVSTGYQTLPKDRVTGSFETVDNKLLNRQISTDVISRLDGLVPGVFFDKRSGGKQNFQVRGLSTLTTAIAKPLIVLDNFPYEGSIDNINPNDVESITFLKDAAASSIWGAKAGNGVVVITTKKANYNQPMQISATSNVTITDKPDLFYQSRISSSDFIDAEIFLFGRNVYNSVLGNSTTRPVITPVVEILNKQKSGQISETDAKSMIDSYRNEDIRNDYEQYLYRKAISQQYAITLNGGSENINYLFSAGYDKNLQNLKENEYNRISLRSQNTFKPVKNMEVQLGILYTESQTQQNNPGEISYLSISKPIYPYASIADENGNPTVLEKNYRLSYASSAGNGKLLNWLYRPLEEIYQADNTSHVRDFLLNTGVRYNIVKGLNAELRYQYENQINNARNFQSEDLFYTRDLINQYTVVNGESVVRNIPLGGILDQTQQNLISNSVRGQLNFNKNWNENHAITAIIGSELRNAESRYSSGRVYGYNDELMSGGSVDLVNTYPIYGGLASNSTIPNTQSFAGTSNRFVSAYANASYTYKDRYSISASARRDASNLFGTSTNNKWKPLWSVGAKWDVSREPFFKWDALSYLGLRATYGYSGNVNNSISALTTIKYDSGLSTIGRQPFAIIQNPPNTELRWENVGQTNLGLDFALKGNRIRGSIEYYYKRSTDLISLMDADLTTGFSYFEKNVGTLQNHGFDISLSSKNITGLIEWNTNFIFSLNKNKLVDYPYTFTSIYTKVQTPSMIPPAEGYPLYSVFSYRSAGLSPVNGNPQGYDANGNVSTTYNSLTRPASVNELFYHGTALPQYYGAFRNDFAWKRISLSVNITYKFDYYFRRTTVRYSGLLNANGGAVHGDYNKRWLNPGDELKTTVPSMIYPAVSRRDDFYAGSEATVEKGDHIRLQDINLSYSLNNNAIRSLPFQDVRLTIYANNLGIMWRANKAGLDPDYSSTPPGKSISFGVNVSF